MFHMTYSQRGVIIQLQLKFTVILLLCNRILFMKGQMKEQIKMIFICILDYKAYLNSIANISFLAYILYQLFFVDSAIYTQLESQISVTCLFYKSSEYHSKMVKETNRKKGSRHLKEFIIVGNFVGFSSDVELRARGAGKKFWRT